MTKLLSARIRPLIQPILFPKGETLFRNGETADCGEPNIAEVNVGDRTISVMLGAECQASGEFVVASFHLSERDGTSTPPAAPPTIPQDANLNPHSFLQPDTLEPSHRQ